MLSRLIARRSLSKDSVRPNQRRRAAVKRYYCVKKSDDASSGKPGAFSEEGAGKKESNEPTKPQSLFSNTKAGDTPPQDATWRGSSEPHESSGLFSSTGKSSKPKLLFSETDDFYAPPPETKVEKKKPGRSAKTAFSETPEMDTLGGAPESTSEKRALPDQEFWEGGPSTPFAAEGTENYDFEDAHPMAESRAERLAKRRAKHKEKEEFENSPRGRAAKSRRKNLPGKSEGEGDIDWDDGDEIDKLVEKIAKERGVSLMSSRKGWEWETVNPEDLERSAMLTADNEEKDEVLDMSDPDVQRKAKAYMEHHAIDSLRDLKDEMIEDINAWVYAERNAHKPSKELMPMLFKTLEQFKGIQDRKDKYYRKLDKKNKKYRTSDKFTQKLKKLNENKRKFRAKKRKWNEERKNDPNWLWHKDWSFWIHKDNLKNPVIYNALTGMQNNCTMSPKLKGKTVVKLIRDLRWAENPPDWFNEKYGALLDDLEEQRTLKNVLEYKKRPDAVRFPIIPWEDLLTAAESELDEKDRVDMFEDDRTRLGCL